MSNSWRIDYSRDVEKFIKRQNIQITQKKLTKKEVFTR